MIDDKVTRRVNLEHQARSTSGQDDAPMDECHHLNVTPTPIDGGESEEENTQRASMPVLRRGPSRNAKISINYRGMMGREEHIKSPDCTFLSSVDPIQQLILLVLFYIQLLHL